MDEILHFDRMLIHRHSLPVKPSRVVILGSSGFVGDSTARLLEENEVPVRLFPRSELDLTQSNSVQRLAAELRPTDTLLFVSALAPCKNVSMLLANIEMARTVVKALELARVAHVVYVSSDAVYRDSRQPLTENSCAEPASIHGVMHLSREVILKNHLSFSLAILRPTLIYGASDPHNGYGPNRFRRLAVENGEIPLFGEGEELRDHVWIGDVARLLYLSIIHGSQGTLNAVSGEVHSFRTIAETIVRLTRSTSIIRGSPRSGPMPHGGYRAFDPSAITQAFPDFHPTPFLEGLEKF